MLLSLSFSLWIFEIVKLLWSNNVLNINIFGTQVRSTLYIRQLAALVLAYVSKMYFPSGNITSQRVFNYGSIFNMYFILLIVWNST